MWIVAIVLTSLEKTSAKLFYNRVCMLKIYHIAQQIRPTERSVITKEKWGYELLAHPVHNYRLGRNDKKV